MKVVPPFCLSLPIQNNASRHFQNIYLNTAIPGNSRYLQAMYQPVYAYPVFINEATPSFHQPLQISVFP